LDIKDDMEQSLVEKIIYINRVAKVVKGGRRFSFSALAVVGDGKGKIGYALGKAKEVPEALRKATEKAQKTMLNIPLEGSTIPHEVIGDYGAGKVVLKPASPGTGVIAGNVVRAIMEAVGVSDILTKNLGSNNPHNVVKATFKALTDLQDSIYLARCRGKYQGPAEEPEPETSDILQEQA
jgi:small subunit ribosomal protein S5